MRGRSASLGLRDGKIAPLAGYAEHGRIRAGAAEDILEAAAQAYVAYLLEGRDCLLIARSHDVRREASRRVRDHLQHLGPEQRRAEARPGSLSGDLDERMAVLADVLGRDAMELSASEYRERAFSGADHLGLLHAVWLDLTERADAVPR